MRLAGVHRIEKLWIPQIFWIFRHYGHVTGFSTVFDCAQQSPVLFVTQAGNVLFVDTAAERAHKLLEKTGVFVVQFNL